MKSIFALLVFALLLAGCEGNKVRVTFKILETGSGKTAQQVAASLLAALQTNTLEYNQHPVLNYTVGGISGGTTDEEGILDSEDSTDDASTTRLGFASVTFLAVFVSWLAADRRSALIVFVLSLAFFMNSAQALGTYDNCKLLDEANQYKLYWRVSGGVINMAIQAKTQGWLALGLSMNGDMDSGGATPGSDIFMGHFGFGCLNGCLNDYNTQFYSKPNLDATQNLELVSAVKANGTFTFEFRRLLNTQDTNGDLIIYPYGTTKLLWASNLNSEPSSNTDFAKHNVQGTVDIDFSQGSACPGSPKDIAAAITFDMDLVDFDQNEFRSSLAQQLEIEVSRIAILDVTEQVDPYCPECQTLEFTFPNYQVPTAETTYACVGFQFPTGTDRHIIKFEVEVDNAEVMHHLILYEIPGTSSYSNTPVSCTTMPNGALPIYAWAPGGEPVVMPPEAGFRVGSNSGRRQAVVQIHYNNPTGMPGLKDSTKLRMYISPTLRANDAGFIFGGTTLGAINIPGDSRNWHQSGTCNAQLGTTKLNVFASMVHMHYKGKKMWTEQIRNGQVIGTIGGTDNYDYNSQKFVPVNTVIQNGDKIVTHCVWNTVGHGASIEGGEDSNKEMCLHALLYYPNINVGSCINSMTKGCACDKGQECMGTPSCTAPFGQSCNANKDCLSCQRDVSCGWCDSSTIRGCVPSELSSQCQGTLQGRWNICGNPYADGTNCTVLHNDCGSCSADYDKKCAWCKIGGDSAGSSACLAGEFAPSVCNYFGGNIGC